MVTSSVSSGSMVEKEDVGGGGGGGVRYPMVKLIRCADSHQFEDRILELHHPGKIGRTVAKAHPDPHNGIFDCKVLSRNHAVIWYDEASHNFFIQDTKSSNGTFVNGERLSKASEQSEPRLIYSGDTLQFGVEVFEAKNAHKVMHGCIIAKIQLILPSGEEPLMEEDRATLSELYELNQHIQEALAREKLLETKLEMLQRILFQTEAASSQTWQALIDEDRLLSRIEVLERQLLAYATDSEDELKEELKWYLDEKEAYQQTAKVTLKKLVDEKLEAVKSVKDLRGALIHTQDEFATLKTLYDKDLMENRRLTRQVTLLNNEVENLKKSPSPAAPAVTVEHKEVITDPLPTATTGGDATELEKARQRISDQVEEMSRLREKLGQMESVLSGLKTDSLSGEDEEALNLSGLREASPGVIKDASEVIPNLKELRAYERNLIQAEKKIARLILVKEKYISLANEKKLMEDDNLSMKKKLEMLTSQSQTAVACYSFSFGILILALVIAFLPYIRLLLG